MIRFDVPPEHLEIRACLWDVDGLLSVFLIQEERCQNPWRHNEAHIDLVTVEPLTSWTIWFDSKIFRVSYFHIFSVFGTINVSGWSVEESGCQATSFTLEVNKRSFTLELLPSSTQIGGRYSNEQAYPQSLSIVRPSSRYGFGWSICLRSLASIQLRTIHFLISLPFQGMGPATCRQSRLR